MARVKSEVEASRPTTRERGGGQMNVKSGVKAGEGKKIGHKKT
jgi:hypothetical protein